MTDRPSSDHSVFAPSGTSAVNWPRLDGQRVWHPFTAMSAYVEENAPVIERADGFTLFDTTGRAYLDGHSSLWCNIHGHRVPEIDQAIRSQLDRVAHSTLLGLGNCPSIELADELVRVAPPGLSRVFYTDCGAAGVEAALKIAYQFHRQKPGRPQERDLFVYLNGAYHGDTVGSMSLGAVSRFRDLFAKLLFPGLWVEPPRTSRRPGDDPAKMVAVNRERMEQIERTLQQYAERIAAVIIEPRVQAAAGILIQAHGFLKEIRELTRRYDIPLIADEIAVGFGRLGTLFACEQEQISPDLLILSKGLTGGYLPLAATLVTEEIYAAFLGDPWAGRTFYHGHTYTGNPLACAAALASLQRIQQRDVLGNARRIEQRLAERWAATAFPEHVEIRHAGTLLGIDLQQHVARQQPFPAEWRVGHQVTLACRRRGVILRNIGDVVVLMPAPAMPLELVDQLCDVLQESVAEVLNPLMREIS